MPKYVLALDTSHEVISLGLARYIGRPFSGVAPFGEENSPLEQVAGLLLPAFRAANSQLLTQVRNMLFEHKVGPSDLVALVVGRGPGSFTGVRIAIATAKGLSLGLRVPLYGVSTLEATGFSLQQKGVRGWALVISDALRKEVYPALFNLGDYPTDTGADEQKRAALSRLEDDFVVKPADYVERLEVQIREHAIKELTLVGTGLEKYGDIITPRLEELGVCVHLRDEVDSHASGMGLLAAYAAQEDVRFASGEAGAVLPIYTRMSDAEEAEATKASAISKPNQRDAGSILGSSQQALECEGTNSAYVKTSEGTNPSSHIEFTKSESFIRLLNPSDLEAMITLSKDCKSPWMRDHLVGEFETAGRRWFGLFQDSNLIAQIGLGVFATEMHVLDLVVSPAERSQGYGRKLLETAMREAPESRCNVLVLEVRRSNEHALLLYQSEGFKTVGERVGYYPDGEDAIVMVNELYTNSEGYDLWAAEAAEARKKTGARILALESSCDETAVAVIEAGEIHSSVIASQIEFHARFGGVVPEIASRKHTEALIDTTSAALAQAEMPLSALDAIAVTDSPGLIGALVVGLAFAKGLSFASGKPLYGINHLEAHLYANILSNPEIEWPFVALVISGGHTSLIASEERGTYRTLGATLDDAAGEAFDKVAKALGLPYPGGPHISRLALEGDPAAIDFPRAMLHSKDYSFSLSGLKTAVLMHIQRERQAGRELELPNIAASFQQAVIDVQVSKAVRAMDEVGAKWFLLAGGVAANSELRKALEDAMNDKGYSFSVPPLLYCTDNAAMVAATASDRIRVDSPLGLDAEAKANAPLDSL